MGYTDIIASLKHTGASNNVSLQVYDPVTKQMVACHRGHNAATNALLTGIAHYLQGDGVFGQGPHILGMYIPRYISLGTMGLVNQLEDAEGLPAGLGYKSYRQYNPDLGEWIYDTYDSLTGEQRDYLGVSNTNERLTEEQEEALRFKDYIDQMPGYGADGYDLNQNNGRTSAADGYIMAGLGPPFAMRKMVCQPPERYSVGFLPPPAPKPCPRCGEFCTCGCCINDWEAEEFDPHDYDTIRCELISDTFPRQLISYRDIIPEQEAELPKTLDVVFSAMISTGALAQFRRKGQSFLFVTEAGLWSRPDWVMSGNNGLLAAYRLAPPNKVNWKMYPDHSVYMQRYYTYYGITKTSIPKPEERFAALQYARSQITEADYEQCRENRRMLKKSIIKVGVNQVVQVIWKIQLGAIEQLYEGSFCPDCQKEYFQDESGLGPVDPPSFGNVCPFCCELDSGDIDLVGEEFCPKICDIDCGEIN